MDMRTFVPSLHLQALSKATEDELVDLAAVLGFTGMLNQVQYHASMENRKLESGGFSGIAKAERPKPVPNEPPNTTDVEVKIMFALGFLLLHSLYHLKSGSFSSLMML